MIENDHFIKATMEALKKLQVGDKIRAQSFKKDRQIIVEKKEESYKVYQDGFEKRMYEDLDEQQLKKLLKALQRKEFPRSNKLWFKVEKKVWEQLSLDKL